MSPVIYTADDWQLHEFVPKAMPIAVDFFLHYVYVILFFWVLAEQLGMPIPSIPLLLTAGTLTGTHKAHLAPGDPGGGSSLRDQ